MKADFGSHIISYHENNSVIPLETNKINSDKLFGKRYVKAFGDNSKLFGL